MQSAWAVLYRQLWPVSLYHIFPRSLITVTIFGKKTLLNIKRVLIFCTILHEIVLILRRIQRYITINVHRYSCKVPVTGTGVPLQAWSGPEGSTKLRFPDFMTMAQNGGKVVSLTHRPPLPPGNTPGTHFCQRLSRPQGHSATGRIMSLKNSNDTIGNRTRDLPVCSVAP